jgi:hypothetical protein
MRAPETTTPEKGSAIPKISENCVLALQDQARPQIANRHRFSPHDCPILLEASWCQGLGEEQKRGRVVFSYMVV